MIEKKTNLFDAIAQIVKLVQQNVENFTKVAVVRVVNDDGSYDVELISPTFDLNVQNDTYVLYSVQNVTDKTINVNSYVYLSAISKRVFVIIGALDVNSIDFTSTDTINITGVALTTKLSDVYNIKDVDDNILISITPDAITNTIKEYTVNADTIALNGNNGGKIEVTDKVDLSNQVASLKDILSDLVTTLTSNVVPDCTLVAPYGAGTGSVLASDLIQLTTKINGLLK
jgi:hypothetical protein